MGQEINLVSCDKRIFQYYLTIAIICLENILINPSRNCSLSKNFLLSPYLAPSPWYPPFWVEEGIIVRFCCNRVLLCTPGLNFIVWPKLIFTKSPQFSCLRLLNSQLVIGAPHCHDLPLVISNSFCVSVSYNQIIFVLPHTWLVSLGRTFKG